MIPMDLSGKVAIVTGAGIGIGMAIALRMAEAGANVVASQRSVQTGQELEQELQRRFGKGKFMPCDISVEEDVRRLISGTVEEFGRLDILVNNAGRNWVKSTLEMTMADWDAMMGVDLRGTFMCCRYALEPMLKQGSGSIINIATVHTAACIPGAAPYDAAKWGLVGLTKSLAIEFASQGIRINAVSPGLIDTQIWRDMLDAAPDREASIRYWRSQIPIGRVGKPEEVADICVFLCTDMAAYFIGSNIFVDGGMTSSLVGDDPSVRASVPER
jgi:NAD(P)-dependent dehydrogenase (short-subunit alcohol dehydrogenase family)